MNTLKSECKKLEVEKVKRRKMLRVKAGHPIKAILRSACRSASETEDIKDRTAAVGHTPCREDSIYINHWTPPPSPFADSPSIDGEDHLECVIVLGPGT